ncbi:hypothetical protein SCUP234_03546 [Seiridium cupressi]
MSRSDRDDLARGPFQLSADATLAWLGGVAWMGTARTDWRLVAFGRLWCRHGTIRADACFCHGHVALSDAGAHGTLRDWLLQAGGRGSTPAKEKAPHAPVAAMPVRGADL